jgi:hypothetical protein
LSSDISILPASLSSICFVLFFVVPFTALMLIVHQNNRLYMFTQFLSAILKECHSLYRLGMDLHDGQVAGECHDPRISERLFQHFLEGQLIIFSGRPTGCLYVNCFIS